MNANDAMLDEIRAVIATEREKLELYREVLRSEANLLDDWAQQSVKGGWSTHQVEPMRKRADELRRIAR